MKKQTKNKRLDKNFFNEMNYELAGDIGAVDNEEMIDNKKLLTDKDNEDKNKNNRKNNKDVEINHR